MTNKNFLGASLLIAIIFLASCSNQGKKTASVDELITKQLAINELPSLATRGSVDSVINIIENSFNDKQYETVNNTIIKNQEMFKDTDLDRIYLYQGVSYAQRGMYTKAYDVLSNNEIYQNSLYEQMANWYLALSMLKTQNVSEAKKLFTSFAKDPKHFKQHEAKEILKSLK